MRRFIATAAIASLGLAACGASADEVATKVAKQMTTTTTAAPKPQHTAPSSNATPSRDATLAALYATVPSLDIGEDDIVIELLDATCEMINAQNGDFQAVGIALIAAGDSFNISAEDAGAVMAAAVSYSCPEWKDAAQAWASS